jgi:hypothetical protein
LGYLYQRHLGAAERPHQILESTFRFCRLLLRESVGSVPRFYGSGHQSGRLGICLIVQTMLTFSFDSLFLRPVVKDHLVRYSTSGEKCRAGGVHSCFQPYQVVLRDRSAIIGRMEEIGPMVAAEFSGWHGGPFTSSSKEKLSKSFTDRSRMSLREDWEETATVLCYPSGTGGGNSTGSESTSLFIEGIWD